MKWIGQHVYDQISRFRDDVYLEDISTGTIASGAHLGLDSNNKIVKAADGGGDLTSIVAGTGLSGTSLTGPIPTLNVDAAQTQITSVGTIGTGVWQGTTIKTAYIGDDQVTEDKLANTLLAEIDANTAKTGISSGQASAIGANTDKVSNVSTNLTASTHISKITINSSDGDNVIIAEASGSIAGVMTVAHHDKLDGIEAAATTDQSKSDIDGLAITTVGTVDTGVWEGTAIATDQQNHLMHYTFSGYAEGNGSTYEMPVVAHSNKAPFEHNTSTGADGLDAISVQNQVRTNGKVMMRAGSLKKWTGWATGENTSGTTNIALFKVTPANDSNSTVSPVLLKEIAFSASGNSRSFAIAETSFSVSVAAGDVVFTGIKGISAKDVYFTSTLEVEF